MKMPSSVIRRVKYIYKKEKVSKGLRFSTCSNSLINDNSSIGVHKGLDLEMLNNLPINKDCIEVAYEANNSNLNAKVNNTEVIEELVT